MNNKEETTKVTSDNIAARERAAYEQDLKKPWKIIRKEQKVNK